jgi:hypothetical protein
MRDIDQVDRTPLERAPVQQTAERRQQPTRESEPRSELSREPRTISGRTYAYCLSPAELETMREIGRFRTVAIDDLARIRYQGKADQMRQDLPALADQGLIQCRTAWTRANREKLAVVVLTPRGKEILERHYSQGSSQQLYAGFVKPAEVAHDAAIYRMYQAETGRILANGGRIRRVVLDYELKQKVYSPLAKAKAKAFGTTEYAKQQADVARQNGLTVINGKIPLPDLRIEYETADGEIARVDLELATHHYHGAHLQTKAEAGFKMYAPADSVGRLTAVLEDREITAGILSL